jgi:hypothetical protein
MTARENLARVAISIAFSLASGGNNMPRVSSSIDDFKEHCGMVAIGFGYPLYSFVTD